METGQCPLCDQEAECLDPGLDKGRLQYRWKCGTCGQFRIDDLARRLHFSDPDVFGRRFLLSAYTKAGSHLLIDEDLLNRLGRGDLRERTVPEKADLILRWFADNSPEYGWTVEYRSRLNYPIGWCRSAEEWGRMVDMLARERKHLRVTGGDVQRGTCALTNEGWEWLARKPQGRDLATAFVAMNFASKYEDLGRAIEEAILNAGYTPRIVSKDLYTGGIMDRVLARIREARFVVADYTENRGGVYYEAGFALGLGKTVFHSCSKEQLESSDKTLRLHFDVAHLKVIPWTADRLNEYAEDLRSNIEAVLGRGPRPRS